MLDRLWFRLLLGMSLALALAVGTVALLTNRATSESFAEYVEDVSAARAMRVERVLERQYQRTQSWNAVEPVVQLVADLAGGSWARGGPDPQSAAGSLAGIAARSADRCGPPNGAG